MNLRLSETLAVMRAVLLMLFAVAIAASVDTCVGHNSNDNVWPHTIPFTVPSEPAGFHHFFYKLFKKDQSLPWASDRVVSFEQISSGISVLSHYGFGVLVSGMVSVNIKSEDTQAYACLTPLHPKNCFKADDIVQSDSEGFANHTITVSQSNIPSSGAIVPSRFVLTADNTVAPGALYAVQKGTQTVVFDIDGTLTTGNIQEVEQLVLSILGLNYEPKINDGAAAVVNEWYNKGYMIIYLTGRPGVLHSKTLEWLKKEKLPPGPVHLCETHHQVKNVQEYKTAYIKSIRESGVDVVAAYGNEPTDIGAYYANGLSKDRTFIFGPHGGEQGSTAISDYKEHLPLVKKQPPASVHRPVLRDLVSADTDTVNLI